MAMTYSQVDKLRRKVQLYESLATMENTKKYDKKLTAAKAALAKGEAQLPKTGLNLTNGVVLDVKKTKRFAYRFLVQTSDALLKESSIALRDTPYLLRWEYDSFRPLEQKQFPTEMQVTFEGGKKPAKASFGLSRLSTNSNWETHTEVSKRYQKVELEDILKQLIKK